VDEAGSGERGDGRVGPRQRDWLARRRARAPRCECGGLVAFLRGLRSALGMADPRRWDSNLMAVVDSLLSLSVVGLQSHVGSANGVGAPALSAGCDGSR
jgi:hypothetical protein